jgi:hypothetical protein
VPEQEFNAWVAEAKTKFSDAAPGTRQIATVQVRH